MEVGSVWTCQMHCRTRSRFMHGIPRSNTSGHLLPRLGVLPNVRIPLHPHDPCNRRLSQQIQSSCWPGSRTPHLVALDAGVGDGELDARGHAEAVRTRVRHVVRVARDCAAQVLRQNRRAPLLRAPDSDMPTVRSVPCLPGHLSQLSGKTDPVTWGISGSAHSPTSRS